MTSPPEDIRVICPKCGFEYDDWMRASLNLELDSFDDEYIDQATSSTCPKCQFNVYHQSLFVREDGVWVIPDTSA